MIGWRNNITMLSDEEKQELLKLSQSEKIRSDMQYLSNFKNRKGTCTIDTYIRFLTVTNAFMNHKRKKFKRIEGDCFKL